MALDIFGNYSNPQKLYLLEKQKQKNAMGRY